MAFFLLGAKRRFSLLYCIMLLAIRQARFASWATISKNKPHIGIDVGFSLMA